MSMPVMDGMSATRAIRQYEQEYNVPRCCIIALTGLASASAKLEAWNAGIDHFMTKPINFKALKKFLHEKIGRDEDTTEDEVPASTPDAKDSTKDQTL
jgi:CheY-like chemotaxis protein